MNKKSKQMKKVAEARWGNRFEIFAQLAKYIPKGKFWNEIKKWKTTHIRALLGHYQNEELIRREYSQGGWHSY